LGWARQLCDVLEYLHSQQPPIIFRDMKPGNIMLTRDGHIKLIDFGIARFFRHSSSQDTQLLGTPGFAPPEQYGKAQTDERSDIYSLAMTLFQLLTNTLSEKGFGLKDVRSVNPRISAPVARALEKATALAPEERYESIEAFRRALFSAGTFFFANDEHATTPEELAELCAHYPDEAADYLSDGEIESWLREIGEYDLARAVKQIRTTVGDPNEAVERFLKVVMGPSARIRGNTGMQQAVGNTGTGTTPPARTTGSPASRGWWTRGWLPTGGTPGGTSTAVVVSPHTIDFGQVYSGISASILLSISGNRGVSVRGTISPSDPWIIVDQTSFDGMSTRVNVRVDSTRLRGSTHYTGTILVIPEGEDAGQDISVTVEVDVLGYNTASNGRSGGVGGASLDEDEDDTLTAGGMTMAPPAHTGTTAPMQLPPYTSARIEEYKAKYGPASDTAWDPLQATPRQHLWLQRGFTFFAAFMAASLFYTLLSSLVHTSVLPPNSWFIAVLMGMVPFATLGTLCINWDRTWSQGDTINRLCTGLSLALSTIGLSELIWQSLVHIDASVLQFFTMLCVTAIGATIGTNLTVSERILDGVFWAMNRIHHLVIGAAVVVGGGLGFVLTVGFAFGLFIPLAVLLGIGVALALVLRVDYLIKQGHP